VALYLYPYIWVYCFGRCVINPSALFRDITFEHIYVDLKITITVDNFRGGRNNSQRHH
jgi:hypothetical protein